MVSSSRPDKGEPECQRCEGFTAAVSMRSQQINVTFLGLLWAFLPASSFSKIFWVVILNLDLDPEMRQVNRTGLGRIAWTE